RSPRSPARAVRFTARRPPRRVPDWAAAVPAVLSAPEHAGNGLRIVLDLGPFDAAPALTAASAVLLAATELHRGADASADRTALARTAPALLAARPAPDTPDAAPETTL